MTVVVEEKFHPEFAPNIGMTGTKMAVQRKVTKQTELIEQSILLRTVIILNNLFVDVQPLLLRAVLKNYITELMYVVDELIAGHPNPDPVEEEVVPAIVIIRVDVDAALADGHITDTAEKDHHRL